MQTTIVRYASRPCGIQWLALMLLLLAPFSNAWAQAQPRAVNAPQRTVLVMGDSLSAAYGLSTAQGWVALLQQRLEKQAPHWRMVNASISGETTAGGAARIIQAIQQHRPAVVVIELGANDALRGLPLAQTRANLARMIGAAHGAGAEVLLIGMRIPPNYGSQYTQEFEQGFASLSQRFDTAFLPFLLEPLALDRTNFQEDNLHPTAGAQSKIRDHVWPVLEPLLR